MVRGGGKANISGGIMEGEENDGIRAREEGRTLKDARVIFE